MMIEAAYALVTLQPHARLYVHRCLFKIAEKVCHITHQFHKPMKYFVSIVLILKFNHKYCKFKIAGKVYLKQYYKI